MSADRLARRCALPLAALLAFAVPASAAGPQDQAAADVLFKEGKKLAAAGDFEHACPKFIESQRLDPTVGTLLNVGNCYEKLGKVASAYGAFREAELTARDAGDTDRQREAARRADALTPLLPKLAIVVPPDARVPGFEVRRDGALVGEGQWGSSMPADVGNHTVEATAPGYKPWSTEIRIDANASAASVRVQPLEKLAAESAPGAPGSTWGAQKTAGVVLGGAGLVGLVVGSVFAAKAAGKNGDSLPHCLPADVMKCDPTGVALRGQAFNAAHVSTGTFLAGGVLLAGGIVVFATAPRSASKRAEASTRVEVRTTVSYGTGRMVVQGAW
jgi:hypothetical protein